MTATVVEISVNGTTTEVTVQRQASAVSVARFGKIDYSEKTSLTRGYELVVTQANVTAADVASLKQAGAKVFVYQAMCATPADATGIRMMQPWPAPASSLILDASGQPLYSSHYNIYFLDFSLPAVQSLCAQHAIAKALALGAAGIFIDGWDCRLGLGALTQQPAPASPVVQSNSNYLAGLTSFLGAFTRQLHASGLQVMLNIGGGGASASTVALWEQWMSVADVALEEQFAVVPSTWTPTQRQSYLARQLQCFQWCETNGKLVMANQDNTAQASNVYALALMLQVAGGQSMWNTSDGQYAGAEFWWPEYDTAAALGAPLGPYSLSNGVYTRQFQHGTVTADTNTSTGQIT